MTLIFEIALGIVLGFWILNNLEAILGLGIIALIGGVLLAIVGGAIYWGTANPRVGAVLILLAVYVIGSICANWIGKRTGLKSSDILGFVAVLFLLVSATTVFSKIIYQVASAEVEPLLYLLLLPIVGIWAWLWVKTTRLIRERKRMVSGPPVRCPEQLNGID